LWRAAQALAHWIQPDVPRYGFRRIGIAEDAVVVFELPELAAGALRKYEAGLLFVFLDKRHKATGFRRGAHESMHVIRHHTIGVDEKAAARRVGSEALDQPGRYARVLSKRFSIFEA
jgi:hypothetical protein